MQRWNQWTRKHEGWVERKRRFQKLLNESIRTVTGEKAPAVANATAPETAAPTGRTRGEQ